MGLSGGRVGNRKRTVNQKQGERLGIILKEINLSQKKAADIMSPSGNGYQNTVYRILKSKAELYREDADALIEYASKKGFFYRLEWLMGEDDFKTQSDYENHSYKLEGKTDDKSRARHFALSTFIGNTGNYSATESYITPSYSVNFETVHSGNVVDGDKLYYSISYCSSDGKEKCIHLTLEELEQLENELTDFCGYLVQKLISKKGESSGEK